MAFFRRVKKRLQGDDPQQLKRELQWLQTQVGRYKGKILAVGLLSLTGTIMGLVSSVASKSASMASEMSVEPCTIPAARAMTLWDTSNTAMTILKVLDKIKMAQAVLNIHLKKIQ